MSALARIITLLGGPGLPSPLPADPLQLLQSWVREATGAVAVPNPAAMALATAGPDGRPSLRMVLCKEIDPARRSLAFYTNLQSRKARELHANPRAALLFHFDAAGRQARIEGLAEPLAGEECDAYFATRDTLSKLGAWASMQGAPIGSRLELAERIVAAMKALGISPSSVLAETAGGKSPGIERPPHWGGYRVLADRVELWTSSRGRLHDRAEWTLAGAPPAWISRRLQP